MNVNSWAANHQNDKSEVCKICKASPCGCDVESLKRAVFNMKSYLALHGIDYVDGLGPIGPSGSPALHILQKRHNLIVEPAFRIAGNIDDPYLKTTTEETHIPHTRLTVKDGQLIKSESVESEKGKKRFSEMTADEQKNFVEQMDFENKQTIQKLVEHSESVSDDIRHILEKRKHGGDDLTEAEIELAAKGPNIPKITWEHNPGQALNILHDYVNAPQPKSEIDPIANLFLNEDGLVMSKEEMRKQNAEDIEKLHGSDIPEPDPKLNTRPAVWDLVKEDIDKRDIFGSKKYKTRLQPFNGRDALWDAYQEALDLVVYLRQTIYERDNPKMENILKPIWTNAGVYIGEIDYNGKVRYHKDKGLEITDWPKSDRPGGEE